MKLEPLMVTSKRVESKGLRMAIQFGCYFDKKAK